MNRRALRLVALLIWAAGAAVACPDRTLAAPEPAASAEPAPNPLVMPPRPQILVAAHRVHARLTSLGCLDCHAGAVRSDRADDRLLPAPELCERCHGPHDSERNPSTTSAGTPNCGFCHRYLDSTNTPVAPPASRETALKFSHRRHAIRNIGCHVCHGRVNARSDASGLEAMPHMRLCTRCHAGRGPSDGDASADCRACHLTSGSVIKTRFSGGVLKPPRWMQGTQHTLDWLTRHGSVAGADGTICGSCHRQTECQSCHDGRLRPRRIHPNDWLRLHGIEAKQRPDGCVSCHRQQSFCLSCHLRLGLSSTAPSGTTARRGSVHPPASIWVSGPRTSRHHATAARRNLSECVGCHQERDCIRCHATAGMGGPGLGAPYGRKLNPHPPGFRRDCARALRLNPRPCYACHRTDDMELLSCR